MKNCSIPASKLALMLNSTLLAKLIVKEVSLVLGVVVAESEKINISEMPTPLLVRRYIGIVAADDLLIKDQYSFLRTI